MLCVFNPKLGGEMMTPSLLLLIAGWVALSAAIISSICWVCLSFTWWRLERKRIKRMKENEF